MAKKDYAKAIEAFAIEPMREALEKKRAEKQRQIESQPVNLGHTEVKEVNLGHTEIKEVNLSHTEVKEVNLGHTEVKEVNLGHTEVKEVNLGHAEVKEVNLDHTEVKEVNLGHTEVKEVNLGHTEVKEVNLSHTEVKEANLGHAEVKEVNLDHTEVKEANLGHAEVKEVNLDHAEVKEVNLDHTEVKEANLDHAEVKEANLGHVEVKEVNLGHAEVKEVNLDHIEVKEANLGHADNNKLNQSSISSQIANSYTWLEGPNGWIPLSSEEINAIQLIDIKKIFLMRFSVALLYSIKVHKQPILASAANLKTFTKSSGRGSDISNAIQLLTSDESLFQIVGKDSRSTPYYYYKDKFLNSTSFKMANKRLLLDSCSKTPAHTKFIFFLIEETGQKFTFAKGIPYQPSILAEKLKMSYPTFVEVVKDCILRGLVEFTDQGNIRLTYVIEKPEVKEVNLGRHHKVKEVNLGKLNKQTYVSLTSKPRLVKETNLGRLEEETSFSLVNDENEKTPNNTNNYLTTLKGETEIFLKKNTPKRKLKTERENFLDILETYCVDEELVLALIQDLQKRGTLSDEPCGCPCSYLASGSFEGVKRRYEQEIFKIEQEKNRKDREACQNLEREQKEKVEEVSTRNKELNKELVISFFPPTELNKIKAYYSKQDTYKGFDPEIVTRHELTSYVIEQITGKDGDELMGEDLSALIQNNKNKVIECGLKLIGG